MAMFSIVPKFGQFFFTVISSVHGKELTMAEQASDVMATATDLSVRLLGIIQVVRETERAVFIYYVIPYFLRHHKPLKPPHNRWTLKFRWQLSMHSVRSSTDTHTHTRTHICTHTHKAAT